MKHLSDLNMNLNKLLNACLESVSSNPESGVAGEIKYNTTSNTPIYYNGQNWVELTLSVPVVYNKTILTTDWVTPDNSCYILNEAITATNRVTVSLASSPTTPATVTQYDTWAKAKIVPEIQTDGAITIHAIGTVPTIDIPVQLVIG